MKIVLLPEEQRYRSYLGYRYSNMTESQISKNLSPGKKKLGIHRTVLNKTNLNDQKHFINITCHKTQPSNSHPGPLAAGQVGGWREKQDLPACLLLIVSTLSRGQASVCPLELGQLKLTSDQQVFLLIQLSNITGSWPYKTFHKWRKFGLLPVWASRCKENKWCEICQHATISLMCDICFPISFFFFLKIMIQLKIVIFKMTKKKKKRTNGFYISDAI